MAIGISVFENIVYYGPNPIYYPKLGTLKAKEKIRILWREDEWLYIEFYDINQKKRGYVQDLFVSYIIGKIISVPLLAEVKLSKDRVTSYLGPIPNIYAIAGTVFEYEPLTVYNVTLGDYTFVEYTIKNNLKKRGFIHNKAIDYDAKSDLIPLVGTKLADFSNESCYGSGSFYRRASLRGQCTWYCWGRAKEKCKKRLMLKYPNNAHNWFENSTKGFSRKLLESAAPVKNSIACFKGGNYGHVVFVEEVENNLVYFTEANANNNSIVDSTDGILKVKTVDEFKNHLGKKLQGYILL
ncbi:CHAP domain-containing protein [Clostridium sp. 'deep sea']|uniref:CHAP domain-containing protein n=1 Tax=Clostridium sp. 'deep sea' TaxID=2779445 RepID=UPI0018968E9D|nr:CHAP domain-containing protein [Clostridium sp. 'deep sea']QOR35990.1 CHAP domain-containing protein [Clostridium sp. 'deep sea']